MQMTREKSSSKLLVRDFIFSLCPRFTAFPTGFCHSAFLMRCQLFVDDYTSACEIRCHFCMHYLTANKRDSTGLKLTTAAH